MMLVNVHEKFIFVGPGKAGIGSFLKLKVVIRTSTLTTLVMSCLGAYGAIVQGNIRKPSHYAHYRSTKFVNIESYSRAKDKEVDERR